MKRLLLLICLALSFAACTKNGGKDAEPEVVNPPHNIIKAIIADYGSSHIWSEGDLFGLYGSVSGENVRYEVEPVSFEKSGITRIYGNGVGGEVFGYYPYNEEDGCPAAAQGRQPLAEEQGYFASAGEQMKGSSILVAKLEDETLAFSWLCGVLHIHVTAGVDGAVESATLISGGTPLCGNLSILGEDPLIDNAGTSLSVAGIGRPCGPDTPLDLYFMLPPGVYPSLSLQLDSELETIVKPIDFSITIAAKTEVNCTVSEKKTVYDGTDIIIIDGEFDD